MRIAWRWLFVGTLVMVGGLWFAVRSAMALGAPVEEDMYTIAAFAVGSFIAGSMISRHALVQPWREPLFAALAAVVVFLVLGALGEGSDSVSGPLSSTTLVENIVAVVVVIAAGVGGAWLARRFSARDPSTGSLLVLGGLVTIGTVMSFAGVAASAGGEMGTVGVVLVLVAPAVGGFITQAAIRVRRPWACGGGALLLLLLVLQEDGIRDFVVVFFGVAMVTLIDVAGAVIAARVFRARWTAPRVELPAARAR